jgi:Ca2+-binding RTX toxin-like protein
MRSRRGQGVLTIGFLALAVALGSALIGAAGAASPCANSKATANALTTVSADGTEIRGSACADRIVVTSPLVDEVVGGDGNDVIFANPNVEVVEAGPGDDVIYGELPEGAAAEVPAPTYVPAPEAASSALATISITEKECKAGVSCYGGDGSQELIGSSGNDKIFGQRGNDILKGKGGNDQLFGGVGDESLISGEAGNDLLSGGLGTDVLNGNQENDLIRGDGTIDTMEDTGPSGTDTLSFATGVTPGFHGSVSISNFPADSDSAERGVYVRIDGGEGLCGTDNDGLPLETCNNDARYGGGSDHLGPTEVITTKGFENIIGSPFADVIYGSDGANRIDGGGGTDVIYGKAGNDTIYGGADGDYLNGEADTDTVWGQAGADNCVAETAEECAGSAEGVSARETGKISVGFMVTSPPETLAWTSLYLTGSTGVDKVKAGYTASAVTFTTEEGSAEFETAAGAGCTYTSGTSVTCNLSKSLDAITVAGMAGDDKLTLESFPELTTPVLLGGEGGDVLTASIGTEDMLVDGNGSGNDTMYAKGYDDALINNGGKDNLQGGNGNDLLLSATSCEEDTLQGAESGTGDSEAVNSASWAKYSVSEASQGVVANLESGKAGDTAGPACTSGATPTTLANIDDLEGTTGIDKLVGDGADNNLLGRLGVDELLGQGGKDNIESAERPTATAKADTVVGGTPTTLPGDTCRYDAGVDSVSGCENKQGV